MVSIPEEQSISTVSHAVRRAESGTSYQRPLFSLLTNLGSKRAVQVPDLRNTHKHVQSEHVKKVNITSRCEPSFAWTKRSLYACAQKHLK